MYAIAIVRYRKSVEQVQPVVEAHRAYLRDLKAKGIVLASGPLDPWFGGALLLRVPDGDADAALNAVRDNDPYVKQGVAQYELLQWKPGIGKDDLDKL